jgi:hypothetical protein
MRLFHLLGQPSGVGGDRGTISIFFTDLRARSISQPPAIMPDGTSLRCHGDCLSLPAAGGKHYHLVRAP